MKKNVLLLFFAFVISHPLFAKNPDFSSLDKALDKHTAGKGPGVAYIVMKDGKILHSKAAGYANIEQKIRITVDTQFLIGSLSKQMTAMATLILEKEGKLNEEEFAQKYLPELPEYAGKIKVHHLIHHQSGLPDYYTLCRVSGNPDKRPIGNAEILEFLKQKKELEFTPGTKYKYNNSGYVTLAEIAQRISGEPFEMFTQKNIFSPLGMKKTYIINKENEPEFQKRMRSYMYWPDFELNDQNFCNYKQGPGSVVTNLLDFSKWLLAVEKSTLIPAELTKKMITPAKLANGEATIYAHGLIIEKWENEDMIWHNGAWLCFNTSASFIPERKLWVAVFSNACDVNSDKVAGKILKVITGKGSL